MNCFYHQNTAAVANCGGCGKGICRDCSYEMSSGSILCPSCFKGIIDFQISWLKNFKIRAIIGIILFIGFILMFLNKRGLDGIFWGIIIALFIASIPIANYVAGESPDPYVPTSFQSAGNLALFKFVVKFLIGPILLIKGIFEYRNVKKILASNQSLLK